jgi:hypothetical protein
MTPHDLYLEAIKRGLRLEAAGDKLAVYPKGHCPPEFAETLRQHKAELLTWFEARRCPGWGAVPTADLPLNELCPNPTPRNRELVIYYILRQLSDKPGELDKWLLNRESAYFATVGNGWDCAILAYAAARDAALWQLSVGEKELWETLDGFEQSMNK